MAHLVWKSCSGEMRGTGRRAQRLGPRPLRGVRRWSRYTQVVSRPPGDTTMVRRFTVSLALALPTLLPPPAPRPPPPPPPGRRPAPTPPPPARRGCPRGGGPPGPGGPPRAGDPPAVA